LHVEENGVEAETFLTRLELDSSERCDCCIPFHQIVSDHFPHLRNVRAWSASGFNCTDRENDVKSGSFIGRETWLEEIFRDNHRTSPIVRLPMSISVSASASATTSVSAP